MDELVRYRTRITPLQIVLPAGTGILTASFNGPPDYDYLPACQSATEASVVEIQSAYTPAA
jgi:hypothetical protein